MIEAILRWSLLAVLGIAGRSEGDVPVHIGSQPLGWPSSELLPGTVVGQGRYVLAEKLCEVCHLPSQPDGVFRALPSSQRLLLDDGQGQGQVVPYEGLAAAIASDLPGLPQSSQLVFLPAVHDYAVSHLQRHYLYHEAAWRYNFGPRLGKGSFGEAWRAVTLDGSMKEVVLKRLFVEKGEHVRRSGEREIYFGTILQNRHHIARFLESFEEVVEGKPNELWLVFENEGFSLTHFLFKTQPGSQVVECSTFWWLMKQGLPWGEKILKNFAYQLLQGIAVTHSANITHRDVKGSNVFVTDTWPPVVRLGDFGSALKTPPSEEVRKMYGREGPSDDDETLEYKPPEAGLFDSLLLHKVGLERSSSWRSKSYDLWSLGILLLEMVLGTRDVYRVDDRRWMKEEFQLRKQHVPEERREQGRALLALLDLCLGHPQAPLPWFFELQNSRAPAGDHSECSDAEFAERLRQQDAAGVGLASAAGRDLLRRLLRWNPEERIPAQDALKHPWFDDGIDLPPLRVFKSTASAAGAVHPEASGQSLSDPETTVGQLRWDLDGNFEGESEDFNLDWSEDSDTALVKWDEGEGTLAGEYSVMSSCPGLSAHIASDDDVGRRKSMEDRHSIQNISAACEGGKAGYFAIFDGHAGTWTATWLARSLHHRLQLRRNASTALAAAFASFDKDQLEYRTSINEEGTGSTALVGVLCNCTLHLANLGDCRAVAALRGTWSSAGDLAQEDVDWPIGARVEVREARSAELQGQRGTLVEARLQMRGPTDRAVCFLLCGFCAMVPCGRSARNHFAFSVSFEQYDSQRITNLALLKRNSVSRLWAERLRGPRARATKSALPASPAWPLRGALQAQSDDRS
ncbi:unnamed protein product [Effrenium voratum]|uniref:Uncharacterized protein n=1 Tax=Effrenium voratum TaxID=2562239 RepID=A0AA36N1Q8_9DINO|nr:unnamed protein product [Effrenium voratum]CAJ1437707.1 unnamed protein product [Effrenium voratum]